MSDPYPKDYDEDFDYIKVFNARVRHMIDKEGLADIKLFPAQDPKTTENSMAFGALSLLDAPIVEDKDLI